MDVKILGGLLIWGVELFMSALPFLGLLMFLGWCWNKEEERMADRIADRIRTRE